MPRHLGGKLEANHHAWIASCLQLVWGKSAEIDNEIKLYLEDEPRMQRSTSSLSSGNSSMTYVGDDGNIMLSSDFDSDRSHTSQTLEQLTLHSLSNGDTASVTSGVSEGKMLPDANLTASLTNDHVTSVSPHKRVLSDTSVEVSPSDNSFPPIPNKKRPALSSDHVVPENLLHVLENGYSIKEFLEVVRIKGRKGLYREYAEIKGENPVGTFDISK